jgi:hypothetical protein
MSFESRQYRDRNRGIQVTFMPYGPMRYWVYAYKDENLAMQLLSIVSNNDDASDESLPVD